MVTAYDVETETLIKAVAEKLKQEVEKPEWVNYVKSGAHTQRLPEQEDFWYIRCASLMWQIYRKERVGVSRLRRHYGGRKNRGVKPEKFVPAGGALIRRPLQLLEKLGYVKSVQRKGRVLTSKAKKLLNNTAKELLSNRAVASQSA